MALTGHITPPYRYCMEKEEGRKGWRLPERNSNSLCKREAERKVTKCIPLEQLVSSEPEVDMFRKIIYTVSKTEHQVLVYLIHRPNDKLMSSCFRYSELSKSEWRLP